MNAGLLRKIRGGGPGSGRYPAGSTNNVEHDPRETIYQHRDAEGNWDADREALHQQIVDKVFAGKTAHPEGPEATLLGGGTASGKTTLGDQMLSSNSNAVRIDSDAIRQQLPEYKQLTQSDAKDASALTHEESSYLAKRMLARALANKNDLIYDSTSSGKTGPALLDRLQAEGYKTHLMFVDVPVQEAVQRANQRAENPSSGDYGRYVPEQVIRDSHAGSAQNFMKMKDHPGVASAHLYDNSGTHPELVYSRSGARNEVVTNPQRWAQYQRKAGHA